MWLVSKCWNASWVESREGKKGLTVVQRVRLLPAQCSINSPSNIQGRGDVLSECHSNIRFNIYITKASAQAVLRERSSKKQRAGHACQHREWDRGRGSYVQLTKLSEICGWLWHVQQLPLMGEQLFQNSFSILLQASGDSPSQPHEKKDRQTDRNYNTRLCPGTRAIKVHFTQKPKGETNACIAQGGRPILFFSLKGWTCATEQTKMHWSKTPFHSTHRTLLTQKSNRSHLSKIVIIWSNIFHGKKSKQSRNALSISLIPQNLNVHQTLQFWSEIAVESVNPQLISCVMVSWRLQLTWSNRGNSWQLMGHLYAFSWKAASWDRQLAAQHCPLLLTS